MRNPKVYLAGPIDGESFDKATSWRNQTKETLQESGIRCFSPMRGKEFLNIEANISEKLLPNDPLCSSKGITTRDRNDVINCDAILVNFTTATKISIGTILEIGMADILRKPIVIAMQPENIHQHIMVKEIAGFIVPTLEEAIAIIKEILLP
jgi:nucleoside 2-deoxyribosyltransferase